MLVGNISTRISKTNYCAASQLPGGDLLMWMTPLHLHDDQADDDDDDDPIYDFLQVEIITHAGPHRRLWMGPQFSFKTYQNTTVLSSNSSSLLSQSPESNMAAMDIAGDEGDLESLKYVILILCTGGNFPCFLLSAFFFKNLLFQKTSFMNTNRISKCLD